MLLILNVAHGSIEAGLMAEIAIGAAVGLEAMFAGPVSGASMNTARSSAPAIVSGHIHLLWIYLFTPFLGAIGATFTWLFINEKNSISKMLFCF
jgi:aquaporin Z